MTVMIRHFKMLIHIPVYSLWVCGIEFILTCRMRRLPPPPPPPPPPTTEEVLRWCKEDSVYQGKE